MVGETPYAEGRGDRTGSMSLDSTDLSTISTLRAAGVPVIVVLVSGRPMDIAAQVGNWNALLASWLPGSEGQGVADVLFGDYNPTGKLPVTWMQSVSQQPINDGDGKQPLYAYGFGLNYGTTPTSPPPTSTVPTSTVPTSTVPTSTVPTSTVPTSTVPTTRVPTSAVPTTGSSASCVVTYKVAGQWQSNFQGDVTIRNSGSSTINGWTLTWTFANGQTITQMWSGVWTQVGASMTVKNMPYNGTLPPGQSTSFGFLATWNNATNAAPVAFSVNGAACAVG